MRAIENRMTRDLENLLEQEEDYYRPVRAANFHNNNDIKYEFSGDTSSDTWEI